MKVKSISRKIEDAINRDLVREYCLQMESGMEQYSALPSIRIIRDLGEKYRSDYLKVNPKTMKRWQ